MEKGEEREKCKKKEKRKREKCKEEQKRKRRDREMIREGQHKAIQLLMQGLKEVEEKFQEEED